MIGGRIYQWRARMPASIPWHACLPQPELLALLYLLARIRYRQRAFPSLCGSISPALGGIVTANVFRHQPYRPPLRIHLSCLGMDERSPSVTTTLTKPILTRSHPDRSPKRVPGEGRARVEVPVSLTPTTPTVTRSHSLCGSISEYSSALGGMSEVPVSQTNPTSTNCCNALPSRSISE